MEGIGGKRKTHYTAPEGEYRDIKDRLNQSMLAVYDENPMDFYTQFILGESKKKKVTDSMTIGNLCDFYLLDCHGDEREFESRFDEKFALFEGNKSSAQAFLLADELLGITEIDLGEDGQPRTSFGDRFKEAFEIVQRKDKYKGKTIEQGLADFEKVAQGYFDACLKNIGKEVVDLRQIAKGKVLVDQLRGDEFHGDFINQETNKDIEVLKKVAIEFEYMGWLCKMELDFMHINHKKKLILRRDLKTAYDNEDFEYSYLKRKYYLQNGFYHIGVENFARENGLEGYTVNPMDFLVLDTSKNNRKPLLYETKPYHIEEAFKGFTTEYGYTYKGVNELMGDITWARDKGIWTIRKEHYENKGIVILRKFEK